jgi:hypothetical protein
MREAHFVWKEAVKELNGKVRLLTPWGDPDEYEQPFDFLFDSPEAACEAKAQAAPGEQWVLCRQEVETCDSWVTVQLMIQKGCFSSDQVEARDNFEAFQYNVLRAFNSKRKSDRKTLKKLYETNDPEETQTPEVLLNIFHQFQTTVP